MGLTYKLTSVTIANIPSKARGLTENNNYIKSKILWRETVTLRLPFKIEMLTIQNLHLAHQDGTMNEATTKVACIPC